VTGNSLAASEIVSGLEQDGVVCLRSFFDRRSVENLRAEAIVLLGAKLSQRSTPRKLKQRCPALYATFNADLFREIAQSYDPKCRFFFDLVAERVTSAGTKITDINTVRSLKFMVYLADVDRSNAAFRYCLGSHHENRKLRHRFLLMGGKLAELPNVPAPGEDIVLTHMEGPDGTLIVFDTDGFHSAGVLHEGKERLLVRARTLLSGWFDNAALRFAARLNPLQFFAPLFLPRERLATRGRARGKPPLRVGREGSSPDRSPRGGRSEADGS
jgi:hypothetical protein